MSSPDLDDGDITPLDVAHLRLEAVKTAILNPNDDLAPGCQTETFRRADAIMRYVMTGTYEGAAPIPKWKKP